MAQRRSSGGQAAAPAMAVPGLGRKFWTMTSWTWPWRACDGGDGPQRGQLARPVVADADQDARW